jgi:mRNA-degrading endonuclease RelE of RelBE toxin-antitoxin system
MALTFRARAVKELVGVPKDVRDALKERLEEIASNPRARHPSVKRLQGRDNEYSVRQGSWRAVYTITGQGDVDVIHVRHRREVYGP